MGKYSEIIERLERELVEVRQENLRLRAALANSKDPCVYCSLPAEDFGRCAAGFPGCARADDLTGCPEFGAALEAHHQEARAEAAEARAAEALALIAEMDKRVMWEALGSGNDFADRIDAFLRARPDTGNGEG